MFINFLTQIFWVLTHSSTLWSLEGPKESGERRTGGGGGCASCNLMPWPKSPSEMDCHFHLPRDLWQGVG